MKTTGILSSKNRDVFVFGLVLSVLFASQALAQSLNTNASSSQSSVVAGTNITYDFSVSNNTGASTTNTVFNLALPVGVKHVANNALCSTGSPALVSCNLGSILDGNFKILSVTLNVSDDYVKTSGAGFVAFSASATSDESPLANTVVGDTPVTESADLRISNFAQETVMQAGDVMWYTILVDNYGPSTARDVVITDNLLNSDQVSIQSCAFSVSQGGGAITQFTCTTGPIVQTQFSSGIGTFRTNFLRSLAIIQDDPSTPGVDESATNGRLRASFRMVALNDLTITSDARVISLTPDSDISNNQQSVVVSVDAAADLALEIDSSGELQPNGSAILPYDLLSGAAFPEAGLNLSNIAVTAGRRVKYSYKITNEGPSHSENVELTSRLPAGVVVVPGSLAIHFGDGSDAPGNCQYGTPGLPSDEMTCGLGTIQTDTVLPDPPSANQRHVRRIEFEVKSDASLSSGSLLVNNVLLGSSIVDIDNSNNLGSSLMVVSPLTGVSGCSAGGAYNNVVCGNGSTVLDLNGFGFALPDTGSLDYQWTTTCPGASFNDATSATPQLSFTTANADKTPVSCQVDLAVQNIFASSTCNALINVVDCAADCFGVLDGSATLDRCGVCNGDGNSCLGCSDVDNSAGLLTLNRSALSIRSASFKAARQLKDDKALRSARRKAKRNFLKNLAAITQVPLSVKTCSNNNFCLQTNNVTVLDAVSSGLEDAFAGLRATVGKLKKQTGNKASGKSLLRNGKLALSSGQAALVQVPLTSSSCL